MPKIYIGQSALTFKLDTFVDLSTASDIEIKYKKPDGTAGSWTGTVTETTKIKYDVAGATILDQAGFWILWATATFAGKTAIGESANYYVSNPGE